MENQRQIEEMAKIVDKVFRCYYKGDYESGIKDFATHLVEFGAIVLPEDSVMLSKAEYNWLVQSDKEDIVKENKELGEQCLEWMELYHKQITKTEQTRKQAIKEFAEKLKSRIHTIDYPYVQGSELNVIDEDSFYELAKEMGVEAEE